MENQGQDLSGKISHLIAVAEDGKHGYENAAKDVKDEYLKSTFLRLSGERDGYITELQDQLRNLGGPEPTGKGGPVGALHRTWIDIKAALTAGDKDAIIKACVTGEEYALKEYQMVIDEIKSGNDLKQLLVKQHAGIQTALSSITQKLDK
ncbi:MAG: PA2169 family four-helix-bundle protein [Sphingobacteriales bacterium JAD_PAG50586_3]|nr:MAG: PA2169 family four-helix-bundle protein [Sphingobacteriales bacterium JAD_PAG50586_3]